MPTRRTRAERAAMNRRSRVLGAQREYRSGTGRRAISNARQTGGSGGAGGNQG